MTDETGMPLDGPTHALVVLAAAVAQGEASEIRDRVEEAVAAGVPATWGDELMLQSVLMVGWPRTLMAAALWRKAIGSGATGGGADLDYAAHAEWTRRGENTCRIIYGDNYSRLRDNVRSLHPALDAWMVTEGYGRTLSRPGLDLAHRELCIVAQTAVLNTPRQLHSHLRGALLAGASVSSIDATLTAVNAFLSYEDWKSVKELWEQVQDGWSRLA